MQKNGRELKEQNDTAEALSREHISYESKFACTWGHYWPSCPETWAGGASRGGSGGSGRYL